MTLSAVLVIIGLSFNFLGSVVVAFSVKENPGGAHQLVDGKKIPLASISINVFRWGIGLLIIGFFIQLIILVKPLV